MATDNDWQPGTGSALIQRRARMLQQLRAFFAQRAMLEVETPVLARTTVTAPHIDSVPAFPDAQGGYLQTSPEYFMKRLLAAGSGAIYQVCKVFRAGEAGRYHNPEFTMLEWYRPGFDQHALMNEVDELVREILADDVTLADTLKLSYRELFQDCLQLDPFQASVPELQRLAGQHQIEIVSHDGLDRDGWLDLLLTHLVEPQLPDNRPVFIYDYPATQAALARLHQVGDVSVASRFELYLNGMELANGYHELADIDQQRQRFERDRQQRQQQGLTVPDIDEKFLSALQSGLPDCAGVALGLDRLLMIATGVDDIRKVISFSFDRL